jgi:tetratricopeptide (TPR) repeat protein
MNVRLGPRATIIFSVNTALTMNTSAALLLLLAAFTPFAHAAQQDLQPGALLPKITTTKDTHQSYALYLPSSYTAEKHWPVVYAFDPAARGALPVGLLKAAAERYGFIVAGSNNSRNGSGQLEGEAAQAMFDDTHARLSIDDRRIYLAGFSGGARLSAELAQHCACAAGVILAGAGFQPAAQDSFVVFSVIGSYDFNYGEMIALDESLQKLNHPHFLRRFDGPHQWPDANLFDEALAWLCLQAMKTDRETNDATYIAEQLALETKRAQSFRSTDPFAAWFEYRQGAETFDSIAVAPNLRAEQKSLETQKAVLDAAKREKQEIKQQDDLSSAIFTGFASLSQPNSSDTSPPSTARNNLREQILSLQARAQHEKNPDKVRVLKRALAGIFVACMETGRARQDANDITRARDYFELAIAADPDSVWALTNLAIARAADGDKKATLEALRRTKQRWTDRQAFFEWLNSEPAFAKIRDTPDFRSLLQ